MRAANRRIRSLVIISYHDLEHIQITFNNNFFPSSPSIQLWAEDAERSGGNAVIHQPKAIRVSKWNSLKFKKFCKDEMPTVEELVTVLFSAVTNLTWACSSLCFENSNIEYLTSLLQHPRLASQLISLTIDKPCEFSVEMTCPLVTAINSLTALQHLAILGWEENIPDLPY